MKKMLIRFIEFNLNLWFNEADFTWSHLFTSSRREFMFRAAIFIFLLYVQVIPVCAEGMFFGIAGKSLDDINFITVWWNCHRAAQQQGDTCIHIGKKGPAHFRLQDKAIREAIERGIDGLAVSVINSEWLVERSVKLAAQNKIPIIAFDSDFNETHRHVRKAYIGMNNLAVGRRLGEIARRFRPKGGTVWLMSDNRFSTNLNERIKGLRRELSADSSFSGDKRLNGEGGWREHARSPWYCKDDSGISLKQMELSFIDSRFDLFISVGHWPVINAELYRKTISRLQNRGIKPGEKKIIIGIGALMPEQHDLLNNNLVNAYVSLDFEEMGKECYHYLKRLASGKDVPPLQYTKMKTYLWKGQSATP